MLTNFLDDNIIILEQIMDWEASIKQAALPLLSKRNIEQKYIDSMIQDIHQNGFYVVLRDFLAMPHSRPENGVNKTGLSLLKLNKPVLYGEHEIYLIFILASCSSEKHVDIIMKLSELFQNDEDINNLIKGQTKEDIIKIINKYN